MLASVGVRLREFWSHVSARLARVRQGVSFVVVVLNLVQQHLNDYGRLQCQFQAKNSVLNRFFVKLLPYVVLQFSNHMACFTAEGEAVWAVDSIGGEGVGG